MRYAETAEGIRPEMLEGFFIGWENPPSPETHLALLQGSDHVVLAIEGGRVVGFVTAITDGVLSAYIPLLEVLPEYQGQGIGKELVNRMITKLSGYYMVDLVCGPELRAFYSSLGMKALTAMSLRNYEMQSGRAGQIAKPEA